MVLDDPIPAGARILGDGDGRDATIPDVAQAQTQAQEHDTRQPTFVERSFSTWRGYYDMLPKGRTRIDYTLRLNNPGDFALPPTRIEAMYAPEIFGELPNARLRVEE